MLPKHLGTWATLTSRVTLGLSFAEDDNGFVNINSDQRRSIKATLSSAMEIHSKMTVSL